MWGPLLDWREWILALTSGLVGAYAYEWLSNLRRQRQWRGLRTRAVFETWVEAVWPYVAAKRWGWAPADRPSAYFIYGGYLRELESIAKRGDPTRPDVHWDRLNQAERTIVRDLLPRLRPLAVDVVRHLNIMLTHYAVMWTDDDRQLFLNARRELLRLSEWGAPSQIPPERVALEIYNGVDLAIQGLRAIDTLAKWASENSPKRTRPPLPTSKLSEL